MGALDKQTYVEEMLDTNDLDNTKGSSKARLKDLHKDF